MRSLSSKADSSYLKTTGDEEPLQEGGRADWERTPEHIEKKKKNHFFTFLSSVVFITVFLYIVYIVYILYMFLFFNYMFIIILLLSSLLCFYYPYAHPWFFLAFFFSFFPLATNSHAQSMSPASCRSKRVDDHGRFYANFRDFCGAQVSTLTPRVLKPNADSVVLM